MLVKQLLIVIILAHFCSVFMVSSQPHNGPGPTLRPKQQEEIIGDVLFKQNVYISCDNRSVSSNGTRLIIDKNFKQPAERKIFIVFKRLLHPNRITIRDNNTGNYLCRTRKNKLKIRPPKFRRVKELCHFPKLTECLQSESTKKPVAKKRNRGRHGKCEVLCFQPVNHPTSAKYSPIHEIMNTEIMNTLLYATSRPPGDPTS